MLQKLGGSEVNVPKDDIFMSRMKFLSTRRTVREFSYNSELEDLDDIISALLDIVSTK